MKSIVRTTALVLLSVILVLSFASCKDDKNVDVWDSAIYTEDTALGEGETTFTVVVEALEKSVTFTVNTNEATVGAALLDCALIEGDEGAYGLYIKKVNGILADYDINQRYWAFYINDEYAMSGVDTTNIEDGVTYKLEYAQ